MFAAAKEIVCPGTNTLRQTALFGRRKIAPIFHNTASFTLGVIGADAATIGIWSNASPGLKQPDSFVLSPSPCALFDIRGTRSGRAKRHVSFSTSESPED